MAKSIAVVGASADRHKYGNKCVRAYQRLGYTVYPVHPTEPQIEGLPAYKSLADVPAPTLDIVSVYLPEKIALKVLPEIVAKPVGQVWFNPGADAPAVIEEAQKLGINVVTGCSIVAVGSMPD